MGVEAERNLQADHIQEFNLYPKNKGRPRKDFKSIWGAWGRGYGHICISRPSVWPQCEAKAEGASEQTCEEFVLESRPRAGPYIRALPSPLCRRPATLLTCLHFTSPPVLLCHWLCQSPGQLKTGQTVSPPWTCTGVGLPEIPGGLP